MLSIIIGTKKISNYLAGYDVTVEKVYDTNLNYTSISGNKVQKILGVQRVIKIKFEPMNTAQISELFTAIGLSDSGTSITYLDPYAGSTLTKSFTCEQLPAASYFQSDDGIDFWTIPDIEFTEMASSWGSA
jgi:hypothetical protein